MPKAARVGRALEIPDLVREGEVPLSRQVRSLRAQNILQPGREFDRSRTPRLGRPQSSDMIHTWLDTDHPSVEVRIYTPHSDRLSDSAAGVGQGRRPHHPALRAEKPTVGPASRHFAIGPETAHKAQLGDRNSKQIYFGLDAAREGGRNE